jgi:hypothetical protein
MSVKQAVALLEPPVLYALGGGGCNSTGYVPSGDFYTGTHIPASAFVPAALSP